MGADKGIMVELEEEADEYTIGRYIVVAIRGNKYDLIFGGNMAVNSGSGRIRNSSCLNDYQTLS